MVEDENAAIEATSIELDEVSGGASSIVGRDGLDIHFGFFLGWGTSAAPAWTEGT